MPEKEGGLPTQVYEIFGWKGLDAADPETEVDPRYVTECQNVDFDYGVIAKRRGCQHVATFSGSINLIYDFQSQQGFTTSADKLRTLVIAGTTLSVISGWPNNLAFSATFTATNALHYAVTGKAGDCYISNENGGIPQLLAYIAGTWRYISAALTSATTAPTVAVGSAAIPSGAYRAKYTYEDIWGNESNPSPASATLTVTSEAVDVGVIVSPDPSVSIINLYLLPPNGSLYQFVKTSSNTTGTISWTGSDATILEGSVAPSANFPCPEGKYLAIYNNMLIVAGDPDVPDALWASHSNFLREFSATPFFRAVSGDGQPVKGFGHSYKDLIIAKADSLFIAEGTDDLTIRADMHNQEYGVLGQPSIAHAYQRMVFFSDDGIYQENSLAPIEVSRPIRNLLRTLNPANLAATPPKQFMATYKYYKKIYACVREATGEGENDTILVWDYELDAWTRWKGNSARYIAAVQNADDYEYLYGGSSAGAIFQYMPPNGGSPNRDNVSGTGSAITASFKTPWLHLPKLVGHADWHQRYTVPSYLMLYAGGEPAAGNSTISLQTRYYLDLKETIQGTFTTTHSATTWPAKVIDPQEIAHSFGRFGRFNWIKLEVSNANLDEHFYIERIVFGFKAKPAKRE